MINPDNWHLSTSALWKVPKKIMVRNEHMGSLCWADTQARFIYATSLTKNLLMLHINKWHDTKNNDTNWQEAKTYCIYARLCVCVLCMREVCRYLSLTEASTQAVTGVLLVLHPLQISFHALFGQSHTVKEVCALSTGLQGLDDKRNISITTFVSVHVVYRHFKRKLISTCVSYSPLQQLITPPTSLLSKIPLMAIKWLKCNSTHSFLILQLRSINMLMWPRLLKHIKLDQWHPEINLEVIISQLLDQKMKFLQFLMASRDMTDPMFCFFKKWEDRNIFLTATLYFVIFNCDFFATNIIIKRISVSVQGVLYKTIFFGWIIKKMQVKKYGLGVQTPLWCTILSHWLHWL